MHLTCLLDFEDTHNVFWSVPVNVHITFGCLLENSKRALLHFSIKLLK